MLGNGDERDNVADEFASYIYNRLESEDEDCALPTPISLTDKILVYRLITIAIGARMEALTLLKLDEEERERKDALEKLKKPEKSS